MLKIEEWPTDVPEKRGFGNTILALRDPDRLIDALTHPSSEHIAINELIAFIQDIPQYAEVPPNIEGRRTIS